MANIDTLDIQFNAHTSQAVSSIKDAGRAVTDLANSMKALNGISFKPFETGMTSIRTSIPTSEEVGRLIAVADAVTTLANVFACKFDSSSYVNV